MAAMTAFWNRGIRCFDIDAVTTKDGRLIAAHPEILGPKISPNSNSFDPASFALEEMRSLGADEEGHPVLNTVLEHYASLVNSNATTKIPYFSENSDYVQGSLFHLDLKGPNLTPKHLDVVQDKLLELGIQNNVAICAGALKDGEVGPGYDMIKHLGQISSRGSMCLVLRDRKERDQNVAMVHDIVKNNKAIRSYATSYKFEREFFSKLRGMPIITWTIDNEETLAYSIESGAAGVVSNHPMKLQKMLHDWIKNGQCVGG
jgi:glycerophosphoryl diester phosphodiesterase